MLELAPWKIIYSAVKNRCNNPKYSKYHRYGGRGIKCLITVEELKELWFRDEAWLLKQPSIDREDNDGNYEYGNCQFIEMVENCGKDKRKPILQYDLNGKFIKEWISTREAEQETGIDSRQISRVVTEQRKQCHGFVWKFKENN